jgi:hypothetical protein
MNKEDRVVVRKIIRHLSSVSELTADVSSEGWEELCAALDGSPVTWSELVEFRDSLVAVSNSSDAR